MKTDWEKEFEERFGESKYSITLKSFIFEIIEQTKQEERERMLKALSKEDGGWANYSEFGRGIAHGKNECLKQVKEIIKELK